MAKYRIIINNSVNDQYIEKTIDCSSGKGAKHPFYFKIAQNAVEVEYTMSKVRTIDYTIEKSDMFREALTKAYLYHALLLNSSLIIKHLSIKIESNEYDITSEDDVNFPFVFSLLTDNDLHLSEKFKSIPDYIVVNSIKYNQKELRFVSLASYLSSKSKTYYIERFNALWTAINALYNYIGKCYEERLVAACQGISRKEIKNPLKIYGNDTNGISAIMYYLKNGCQKPTRKYEDELKLNHKNEFQELLILFQKLSNKEISELYNFCLADLQATGISYTLPAKYKILDDVSALYQLPSYVFMLLQYAYSLRCELFHGNKSTPIICSYNDRSIGELRVVNYFLDTYLDNEIPLLFTTNYYDNMHNDVVKLMNSISPDGKRKSNQYDSFINGHQ